MQCTDFIGIQLVQKCLPRTWSAYVFRGKWENIGSLLTSTSVKIQICGDFHDTLSGHKLTPHRSGHKTWSTLYKEIRHAEKN
uniref:Uncharacterized protein n=1 Tax=Ixodes ricinus TaxID=34613 RepID=A0A6B0TWV8_IXORI